MVAKAILGSGLSLATNAAITRALGTFLGPAGWIASGVWIAVDLAGPAFRKTVPAVIHVALLRTILTSRITIGVVGDGSSGKDALLQAVFGIESAIDPVAGSTDEAMIYPLTLKGNAHIVNYPGFNDYRTKVNEQTDDYLFHTDVFVMVVDINRGISGTDLKILERLKSFGKPILICLNKVDLPRTKDDLAKLRDAAQSRLNGYPIVETAFDPDPRLQTPRVGCKEVYDWIRVKVESDGKGVDAESFPPFKGR
jgi:small GTP-binding protein